MVRRSLRRGVSTSARMHAGRTTHMYRMYGIRTTQERLFVKLLNYYPEPKGERSKLQSYIKDPYAVDRFLQKHLQECSGAWGDIPGEIHLEFRNEEQYCEEKKAE